MTMVRTTGCRGCKRQPAASPEITCGLTWLKRHPIARQGAAGLFATLCDHDTGDGFEHSDFAVAVQEEAGTVDYQAGPS